MNEEEPGVRDVVVVEAVRSAVGRRKGGLSGFHSADLLGAVLAELVHRSGIDPAQVGQIIGGCGTQVGQQAGNITRTAWLGAGLPLTVAATTVDAQCGSAQQSVNLAASLVASGVVDCAVGCGVEVMSGVPMGSNYGVPGTGKPYSAAYREHYRPGTQFQGAELIAQQWGLTRDDVDAFAYESQHRGGQAVEAGTFDAQIVALDAPVLDEEGKPTGQTTRIARDEGPRPTTREALAALKPVVREGDRVVPAGGVHTAGNSSQISDGAAAVLVMSADVAKRANLRARARIVDACLIGSDPTLMLTGPIDATRLLLDRAGLSVGDIDTFEINEAFASVVLAWQAELSPDPATVNPHGGAIALGHPIGATGAILLTKALAELERTSGRYGLVSMCCGGGLGTGTLLERL
jgi:acetyl-CoA C-acetyltransferase